MKLKIFEETNANSNELILKLNRSDEDNGVYLDAVDEEGVKITSGHIVKLTEDGKLNLCAHINDSLGLELDTRKRIKIQK